jgi:hypothetical protein
MLPVPGVEGTAGERRMTVTTATFAATPGVDAAPPAHRPLWPRLLAVAVVAQPLLIAVNAIFHPEVDLNGEGLLQAAMEGPTRWYAVHMVAALGAVVGAPAALGLRRLVHHGGRRLADAAVVSALLAAVLLSMTFAAEGSLLRLAATAGIDEADAVALVDAYTDTPEFYGVGLGALAATLSGVLFALALLRDGRVPRWMPVVLLVGSLGTAAAAPGTPIGPLAFGIITVASAALARRVAAAATSA